MICRMQLSEPRHAQFDPVMRNVSTKILQAAVSLAALFFIILAAIGCYLAWSPVPIGDMWNGYLGFYMRACDGDLSAWWAQHNEHRILLSRIFFWLDIALFHGKGRFLLLVNYLLMLAGALTVFLIWRSTGAITGKRASLVAGMLLVIWTCSWIQHDNLTWGFQSQFFLAQLLPLLAFHLLNCAVQVPARAGWYFAASACCGVLALGSMANGVLALPLLVFMALLLRRPRQEIIILVLLAVAGLWLYFHDYVAPGGHGSLRQALKDDPGGILAYMLAYLGGPFYYFLGKGKHALLLAQIAGLALIQGSVWLTWRVLKSPRQHSLVLAMLFFILYVGGTAFATAGGRLIFGLADGPTSRYMTPALLVWAAFFIAVATISRIRVAPWWRIGRGALVLALLMQMTSEQWKALEPRDQVLYHRDVAALAMELRIHDAGQIAHVFPFSEWGMRIARGPSEKNISLFGLEPWADLAGQMDKSFEATGGEAPRGQCQGHLDEVSPVPEAPGMLRVRGWIHDAAAAANPRDDGPHATHDPANRRWTLVDAKGTISGFALSGEARPDVAAAIAPEAGRAGYRGYVRAQTAGATIRLERAGASCSLTVTVPQPPSVSGTAASPATP